MIAARLDDQPREQVDQPDAPLDRQPGVPRPLGREADRAPARGRSSIRCSRTARTPATTSDEDRQLRRDLAPRDSPGPGRESRGEVGEVVDAAGQALGQAAEERERAERHDERRDAEPGDRGARSSAPGGADRRRASSAAARRSAAPRRARAVPKTTADRPISEPTERSMPPLTITGVSATASRPISTLRRDDLEGVAGVRKLVPMTAKTATSTASDDEQDAVRRFESRVAPASSMQSRRRRPRY